MDLLLQSPCSICAFVNRKRSFHRRFQSANTINYSFSSSKFRLKPMSELQMPIGVTASPTTTLSPPVPTHKVTVHDRQRDIVHEFFVPEDQYILHTAESQDISLPFACRHGCCTSCAVRIKSGEIRQPEALGISAELRSKGYALLCVGFPTSDIEVETQDEDEMQIASQKLKRAEITRMSELAMILKDMMYSIYQVYWLQFGRYFARGPIERDDYALELAMGDE